MGLLDKIKNSLKEPTKYDLKEVKYYISSASYYQEQLDKLMSKIAPVNNRFIMETPDENSMIVWKYDAQKVKCFKFEKEPKNPNDPNAIKILAGSSLLDIVTIGYIPRENNIEFAKWMDNGNIHNVNLRIFGGEKKVISSNNVVLTSENYKVYLSVLIK